MSLMGSVVNRHHPQRGEGNIETFPAETAMRVPRSIKNMVVPRNCVEVPQGNRNWRPELTSAPLASFRSVSAYVLLGDPGSGKTTAFEVEAEAAGDSAVLVSARDFITFDVERHPEWGGQDSLHRWTGRNSSRHRRQTRRP